MPLSVTWEPVASNFLPEYFSVSRQAFMILGMHRCGTSALTRVVNLLGATLPNNLMPPHEDNAMGYWESEPITRFNNRLLKSAGLSWDDDMPIPFGWFDTSQRYSDYVEAQALINEEFGKSPLFVLKDPRICRLFPFWERVLASLGIAVRVAICLRDPLEVAGSLARRFNNPELHPAAIPAHSRTLLLWLRYVLEAEVYSRHLPRMTLDYSELVADWRSALAGLDGISPDLKIPDAGDPKGAAIDAFLDAQMNHQSGHQTGDYDEVAELLKLIQREILDFEGNGSNREILSSLVQHLDRLVLNYKPLRSHLDRLSPRDVWAEVILKELASLHELITIPSVPLHFSPTILFLSRTTQSRAHIYRVLHPVKQLTRIGWNARWTTTNDTNLQDLIASANAVIVSRGSWGTEFETVRAACSLKGIPLICDVDDLTFEPNILKSGHFAYFEEMGETEKQTFLKETMEFQAALSASDAVFATTTVLAEACACHTPQAFVLPNCFSDAMLAAAETAQTMIKPSSLDDRIRVGFASGTPTHTRDFASIAHVLADFLEANPKALLVIVGYLHLPFFPCLAPFADRIEKRPTVPLEDLHSELARFDINLAPLEIGNPFCECKSQIRFTAAAALGIPTIASATEPMRQAIIDQETGLLAKDSTSWRGALQTLFDDSAIRAKLGKAARIDTRARFGPEKTAYLVRRFLGALIDVSA